MSQQHYIMTFSQNAWGGGSQAMVLDDFQCQGVILIWIIVGQGPTVLAVGAGSGCFYIFLSSITFLVFLPLRNRSI